MPTRCLFALICALVSPLGAKAGDAAAPEAPVCSVITVAPGDSLDALFGHTAIRIRDPRLAGGDVWFDYGVFDPSDWTFWIHYAKGDAKYLLVAADPQSRLDFYKEEGRAVVEQKLDLKPEEARKLEDYLIDDLENGCGKTGYEYRFLDDNCTTRAKEAIEKATGEKIKTPFKNNSRLMTDLHLSRNMLAMLGANLLMGSHADHPTTVFLPILLQDSIERYATPTSKQPHRFGTWAMGWAGRMIVANAFLTGALVVFGGICAYLSYSRQRNRVPLPPHAYLDALLFFLVGAIGSLMTFLGFWSLHPELGAFNWNLIWCWPTHLIFAAALLFSAHHRFTRTYARIAAIGASCAALAYFFVPQALPVPLFPLVLLLALRAWRWGWSIPNIALSSVAPPPQPR